jgi:hypothetical protein
MNLFVRRSVNVGIIAGFGTIVACGTDLVSNNSNEDVSRSAADLSTVPHFNDAPSVGDFVVYARQSVTLGNADTTQSGDIGVQTASGPAPQLKLGTADILNGSTTLIAPAVSLGALSTVGVVQTTTLTNNGAIDLVQGPFPAAVMPSLPAAVAATPGSTNVTVGAFQIQTLAPGNYGNLNVTGTVLLNPGAYSFASITLANSAHLTANLAGNTTILVAGNLVAGQTSTIQPAAPQFAGNLKIGVSGTVVSIGSGSTLTAVLTAPNATLTLSDNVTATGAFAANNVVVGNLVALDYQSGFTPPAGAGTPCALTLSADFPLPPLVPIDGVGTTSSPLTFVLPASVPVTGGTIGASQVQLSYTTPSGVYVNCSYAAAGLPVTSLGFVACTNLAAAGSTQTGQSFTLHVVSAVDLGAGPVTLTATLDAPPAACNDNNLCTADSCGANGLCQNVNNVVCTALDQCHVAGACVPSTGVCTNPNVSNGSGCNDGNACTRADTCESGVCTGSNPVTCTASDICHAVGSCDPTSGVCSDPADPNGTTCNFGTCQSGSCSCDATHTGPSCNQADSVVTIETNSTGSVLATSAVPGNGTFAFAVSDGDLNGKSGFNTLVFTAGTFPPNQELVAYDYPYGTGADDEGGQDFTSDVLSGLWPCLNTHFTALTAAAGQTVSAPNIDIEHVIRYTRGTCRADVDIKKVLQQVESGFVGTLKSISSLDVHYDFLQPQFRSQGTNIQTGFLYEGDYAFTFGGADLIRFTIDPAYFFGTDVNGLFSVTNLVQNVSALNDDRNVKGQVQTGLKTTLPQTLMATVDKMLTVELKTLIMDLGLPQLLKTSCSAPTTDNMPSSDCFGRFGTLVGAGAVQSNFVCDSSSECAFHPTIQVVNVLPTQLEFVLSPDLSNPGVDNLTPIYKMMPTTMMAGPTIDCSAPTAGVTSGNVATIADNPTNSSAAGILCGANL